MPPTSVPQDPSPTDEPWLQEVLAAKRMRIILVAPRIAANVGNIARTCSALKAELHLVGPLGFFIDQKHLKRSSVGYWEDLTPQIYRDAEDFWSRLELSESTRIYWATKFSKTTYTDLEYAADTVLIFGNEEEGVDAHFWEKQTHFKPLAGVQSCRIPMALVRCLNLATSVGILGYEVMRQWGKGIRPKN
jgi:tRNA (cytidine/uridine-2'-O-)-methyltransferase